MNTRQIQFIIFSLIVSAGIFYYLFSKVSVTEVVALIQRISFVWISLFLVFSIIMSLFRTWRYRLLLSASGYSPSSVSLFLVTLVRNFFSDLLPARLGTLIYVYLIRSRLNIPLGPAFSSFAYSFLFDIIALSLILLPAIVVASFGMRSAVVLVAVGTLLGGISGGIIYLLPRLCIWIAERLNGFSLVPEKFLDTLQTLLKDTAAHLRFSQEHGIYWQVLALSVAVRLCKYLSMYFLLLGLVIPMGYSILSFPFATVFLGMCSAEMASSLPISGIAGFGAYEGAWALVFQLLGYSEKVAILTSISHHLITQVYGYSLGGLALIVLLLPVFKHSEVHSPTVKKRGRDYFWLRFGTAVIVATGIGLLMLPEGSGDVKEVSAGEVRGVDQASGIQLRGRLVYERPDGIYLTDIESNNSRRLAEGGTYPRWSPDGNHIAFVQKTSIMLISSKGGKVRLLANANEPRALCFTADGRDVLFTDGKRLRRVEVKTRIISDLPLNGRFLELDMNRDARYLAATVKTTTGYKVRLYSLSDFSGRTVARGCSASLSPDGSLVTVNSNDHKELHLYNTQNLQRKGSVETGKGSRFDNQFWSNHPDWLVSTFEGKKKDIFLHNLAKSTAYQVTFTGDSDRGDLFVLDSF